MRGFRQVAEARGRALPIEKIDADVTIARGSVGRAAGHAHDRPVILLEQPLDDVAPDDPERSDDDGLLALSHGTLPVVHRLNKPKNDVIDPKRLYVRTMFFPAVSEQL